MNKKVIYTAIIGNYDQVIEPIVYPGWDYILFTDNRNIKSKNWTVVYVNEKCKTKKDRHLLARKIKVLYQEYIHPSYKVILWHDANISLKQNPDLLLKDSMFFKNNLLFILMSHPDRNCIYQEAKACVDRNKDTRKNINDIVFYLRKKRYPENNGMTATGFMVRKNTFEMRRIMELWYKEIATYSHRDQLSFNFILSTEVMLSKYLYYSWRYLFNNFIEKANHSKKVLYE